MIVKPLIVDVPNLSWDALELFELLQEKVAAGERLRIREMKQLIGHVFTDWTVEDAGKITQSETQQVFDALVAAFAEQAPPKETGDS
ncbi:MAG: hypothetical protein IPO81_09610 [Kouleothrix sp.]|nr:hypothetical protein [Kouleothrix sp.]